MMMHLVSLQGIQKGWKETWCLVDHVSHTSVSCRDELGTNAVGAGGAESGR